MSSVRILIDNYSDACYPGQTIAGRVECNFNTQTSLRAVRIKFKGRAETEWDESESYYDDVRKETRDRTVRYNAVEPYFEAEYNLVQGGDNFTLPPGRHMYPFSYILPPQLPSSYEGIHGNVRYYVKATVDRPWKGDYEHEIPLNVVSPLDLNYFPELREPINTSVDKTMCSCWCNDAGALTFNMSLPARGFVPGQEISIGAHVENMTNVSAEKVKFKIIQRIKFIAHYPSTNTNYESSVIAVCKEGGIGAHGEKSWTSCITIPPAHLPNLNSCSIINIGYTLEAAVVVPCPHSNLEVDMPITIGTIPLTGINTIFPGGPPPEIRSAHPYPSGDTNYQPAAPGSISIGFGEKSPSAPPADTPYTSGGLPYPPGSGGSLYSEGPTFSGVPVPSVLGGASAPFPSGVAPYLPTLPTSASAAPPSYEETQQLNEKSGKLL